MASQLCVASRWTGSLPRNSVSPKVIASQSTVGAAGVHRWQPMNRVEKRMSMRSRIRSRFYAVASEADVAEVGEVTEVNLHTFWPIVEAAGSKPVVLDMYTQWCGPCKVMAPKFQELSVKYRDVVFLKLDCNQDNKPLAKELGIKVVPTFKILKDKKIVKEVTGAKLDDLIMAIENARQA